MQSFGDHDLCKIRGNEATCFVLVQNVLKLAFATRTDQHSLSTAHENCNCGKILDVTRLAVALPRVSNRRTTGQTMEIIVGPIDGESG